MHSLWFWLCQVRTSLCRYIAFIDALGRYGKTFGEDPGALLDQYPAAPETLARESLTFNRQIERLVYAFRPTCRGCFSLLYSRVLSAGTMAVREASDRPVKWHKTGNRPQASVMRCPWSKYSFREAT